jgi:hypothetical protein
MNHSLRSLFASQIIFPRGSNALFSPFVANQAPLCSALSTKQAGRLRYFPGIDASRHWETVRRAAPPEVSPCLRTIRLK